MQVEKSKNHNLQMQSCIQFTSSSGRVTRLDVLSLEHSWRRAGADWVGVPAVAGLVGHCWLGAGDGVWLVSSYTFGKKLLLWHTSRKGLVLKG